MSNTNIIAIEKLCHAFPKLTEANQQYVLGFTEGLKKAQNNRPKEQLKTGKNEPGKANG